MLNVFEVKKDEFNSDNFKILMGNIIVNHSSNEYDYEGKLALLNNLVKNAKKDGYKHLTLKVPTSDKQLVKCAINLGMNIADTLVRYTFDFEKATLSQMQYKCELGDCKKEDLESLKEISRTVFKIDRFHSDDSLPNDLCDQYYSRWIENSFNGLADKIVVAYYNNEPVGYTTAKVYPNDDYVQMVLSAVSDKYKGIGTYTSMIHFGSKWLIDNYSGTKKGIIVGTQIDNVAVQKTWIKLGYTIKDSQYVFQIAI